MKNEQIKIGNVYAAKVTDKVVPVRIDAVRISLSTGRTGGWDGTNLKTNRKVVIKSAAKLRKEITVPDAGAKETKPDTKQPVKKKLSATERRERVAASNAKPKTDAVEKKNDDAPKAKRLSLIDAAVQVLGDSGGAPLNCKQMVEQITERGLWSPGTGKTPHATLYSAILRELQKKGDEARFTKVERGQFALTPGMKKGA